MERSHRVSISFSSFSLDGKDFCQFMTPNFPKPMFLAEISPGLVGIFFSITTWHLALGQWPWPWPWDRANLDQGWGSTWTNPIPNLAQAEPRAWSRLGIRFGAHLGPIFVWGPFGSRLGSHFCLGPIWVPFGDPFLFGAHLGTRLEAEG